jgi:hypothetical protein
VDDTCRRLPKIITPDFTARSLGIDEYYRYCSPMDRRFLKGHYKQILTDAAKETYIQCPDVKNIWIGDACPLANDLYPDHPHGTHNFYHTDFDFDYITISGKGTQYAPDRERIWIDDTPGNMVLDRSKIHWQANYIFCRTLYLLSDDLNKRLEALGHRPRRQQTIIHEKIYEYIVEHLSREKEIEFYNMVSQDVDKRYHHHTHGHRKNG